MAIETPVEVLQRLREKARQERVARAEVPAQAFRKARSGKERASAFGQQIGAALAQAVSPEQDLEQDPAVLQAKQRNQWLNVTPDDIEGLKANIKSSADAGDYEVSRYLTDRYVEAEKLRLARATLQQKKDEASQSKKKDWKWKHWQTDTRNIFAEQAKEEAYVRDLNDEDEEAKVADAVVARAESLWNTYRERDINISPEMAFSLANKTAGKYLKKGLIDDTFDFEGFRNDFSTSFNIGEDKFTEERVPAKRSGKAPPKAGDVRDGHRFLGGNPKDPKRWRKIGSESVQEDKRGDGFVDVPMRNPLDTLNKLIKKKAPVAIDDDDDFDI